MDIFSDHVGPMLAHATQLHREAMAALERPGQDRLGAARLALGKLQDAELLAQDADSYLDGSLAQQLVELTAQQQLLRNAIVQLELCSLRR